VVNFTPWPLYPREKSPRYPLDRRLGGPQSRSGRFGEVKIIDPTGTRTPTPQSSNSRYTDCAIPAPWRSLKIQYLHHRKYTVVIVETSWLMMFMGKNRCSGCHVCSKRRLIGHWLTRVMKTQNRAFITIDGVTRTDPLIRWSPNEWPSVCREIPMCAV
jgi:hypothetical protein